MKNPKVEKCPRCGSKHITADKSDENGSWQARCMDCHKQWAFQQTHFNGELMTCALCGKREQHVVGKVSNWRLLELDDQEFYTCPDHLPPDGASKEAFAEAYSKIFMTVLNKRE